MRQVAIVTGRNMASVELEAGKICQTFRDKGDQAEIFQFDVVGVKRHFDLIVWWTPLIPHWMVSQQFWLRPSNCSRCISYFVIEGYVMTMSVWKDWIKWQYIVTPSKFSKSQIEAMGFTVKEVIPHQIPSIMPIDHEYGKTWREKFPTNKKILLYNGSQILRKSLPSLKLAIDMLSKKRDDFIMVYHTDKQNMPFHTPISELQGKNSIIETDFPYLPISKAYAKMSYADIIIHPAIVEGFGLPVLEALNLGKPLVCINAPGVNEIANPKNSFMVQKVMRTTLEWQNYIKFPVVQYKPDDLADQIELALDATSTTLDEKKTAGLETAKRYYNTYKRFTEI